MASVRDRVMSFGINRAFQGVAMERRRSLVAAPLAVAALLTAGGAVTASAAEAAPASAPLTCQASMSDNHPAD
jgi:hypothetical protein